MLASFALLRLTSAVPQVSLGTMILETCRHRTRVFVTLYVHVRTDLSQVAFRKASLCRCRGRFVVSRHGRRVRLHRCLRHRRRCLCLRRRYVIIDIVVVVLSSLSLSLGPTPSFMSACRCHG